MTTAENNDAEKKDNGGAAAPSTGPAAAAKTTSAPTAGKGSSTTAPGTKTLSKSGGKPNWSLRLLLLLLLFLAGGAATLYFLPWLEGRLPVLAEWTGHSTSPAAVAPDMSALGDMEKRLERQEQAIAALEEKSRNFNLKLQELASAGGGEQSADILSRLQQLEQQPAAPDEEEKTRDLSQSARIDMLLGRMSQLEASFVPLSKNLVEAREAEEERSQLFKENSRQNDQISALESRLAQVEAFAAKGNRGAALAFSLSRLREKVVSGEAYAAELENFRTLLAGTSIADDSTLTGALATLERTAGDGLTSAVELRDQFEQMVPDLIRAEQTAPDAGWWQKVKDSLANLVTIRDKDARDETSFDSLLRNLEKDLMALDLEDALAMVKKLPDRVQKVLDGWMLEAESWLNSRRALADIEKVAGEALLEQPGSSSTATPEETSL